MTTKLEVSYEPGTDEDGRLKQVAQILSGAVYAYLKRRRLLRQDADGSEEAARSPKVAHGAACRGGQGQGEDS